MQCCRIELGEDKPFIELLPELLRNYGHAVEHGNRNIYQALPRMLTIWFEYGDYCCANISPANTKVLHLSQRPAPNKSAPFVNFLRQMTDPEEPAAPRKSFLAVLFNTFAELFVGP